MAEDAKVITLENIESEGSTQWIVEGTSIDADPLVSQLNIAFNTTLSCRLMGHKIKVLIVTPQS